MGVTGDIYTFLFTRRCHDQLRGEQDKHYMNNKKVGVATWKCKFLGSWVVDVWCCVDPNYTKRNLKYKFLGGSLMYKCGV